MKRPTFTILQDRWIDGSTDRRHVPGQPNEMTNAMTNEKNQKISGRFDRFDNLVDTDLGCAASGAMPSGAGPPRATPTRLVLGCDPRAVMSGHTMIARVHPRTLEAAGCGSAVARGLLSRADDAKVFVPVRALTDQDVRPGIVVVHPWVRDALGVGSNGSSTEGVSFHVLPTTLPEASTVTLRAAPTSGLRAAHDGRWQSVDWSRFPCSVVRAPLWL